MSQVDPVTEIEALQTELCILQSHLDRMIERIRQNDDKLHRFHTLETELLALNSLRELVEHVLADTRAVFDLAHVSLTLIDRKGELRQFLMEDGLQPEKLPGLILVAEENPLKDWFGRTFRPYLGDCKARHRHLFSGECPASIALLPLGRRGQLLGSLNLGSDEADRFSYGMATDFLDRLRSVLSVCLENTLNFELLRRTSLIDTLTGVNNRRFFEQRLSEEIDRAQRTREPLTCLFLDIDHFKKINDTYGHQTGDLVLAEVAQQIRTQLRSNDVLARYGGEEFVALLPGANLERGIEVAERIRQRIENLEIVDHNQNTVSLTLSIGVAEYDPELVSPVGKEDLMRLLELADQALYVAKREGRNQVESGGVLTRLEHKAAG
ncbi:two-component system, cell cycle response regulator [Methylomarinovum caldicuralii]|uniref:diguanylate cyclase n=1 Tax=Methylomarinovum caldicuralii TaxID=438856 RepID=A0AAU9BYP9_9GAMM|nr:sensor domain-containing diguanylate cyclase [Methylomarinovum caldicuralii]BCX81212.1 two-component system, cell cycle response regulator [Methylomarinovum caldicuralii]